MITMNVSADCGDSDGDGGDGVVMLMMMIIAGRDGGSSCDG